MGPRPCAARSFRGRGAHFGLASVQTFGGGDAATLTRIKVGGPVRQRAAERPVVAHSNFPGVQFFRDPEALNQFFRSMTPNTGPFDVEVITNAVSALFDKIGPAILVTHSQSGGPGWVTAIKNRNVRAIVAYEPGSNFVFPEGEVPAPMPSSNGTLEGVAIPLSDFMQLTKIPIIIYFGDNILEQPTASPGEENWRVRLAMARLWRDAINRRGGDVTLVHLPEIGIHGNTHFLFSDLNNVQIADLMSEFLKEKGLD